MILYTADSIGADMIYSEALDLGIGVQMTVRWNIAFLCPPASVDTVWLRSAQVHERITWL